jgi:hypothetical protein
MSVFHVKKKNSGADVMRATEEERELTAEEVWGGGDGGTGVQVVAEKLAESRAHVRSQASARTARHRRPHGQTSTTATIRGVT